MKLPRMGKRKRPTEGVAVQWNGPRNEQCRIQRVRLIAEEHNMKRKQQQLDSILQLLFSPVIVATSHM